MNPPRDLETQTNERMQNTNPCWSESSAAPLNGHNSSILISNLAILQEKAGHLENFIQNNYSELEGGLQQQAAAAAMSSILYDLVAAGSTVLQSVQSVAVDLSTELAPSLKEKVEENASEKKSLDKSGKKQEASSAVGLDFEILEMNEDDILVEHTHFCEICGKGFRRDANVRMHMRAHGNEYKTPEALMSHKEKLGENPSQRRYSCPFEKCRRNRNHRKFKPLKSIASLRNHYKRSHCPKMYTCNKCNKHFSVVGDLKTHSKTCGHNRWRCSCGTTFTRKDKLFGHVSLFEGHRPMLPLEETSSVISPSSSRKRGSEASAADSLPSQYQKLNPNPNPNPSAEYLVENFDFQNPSGILDLELKSDETENRFYETEFWSDFPTEFAEPCK
eukprot:TRINITY_DN14327_c1_g1_i1.p1 TRINITY_DN14327_c1_g1~~TRINITY_DN14327_c1_g1_i1.p1  ORF type:complete len:389 (-),score=21.58 TRINITY_DN14327_c1_g1_i1:389-1555(-)